MEYIEQFGAVGYCLVMKPNNLLVNASTVKGEEFLLSDTQTSQRFSAFCGMFIHGKIECNLNQKYETTVYNTAVTPYCLPGSQFFDSNSSLVQIPRTYQTFQAVYF